jgi:hypothetical protein
MDAPNESVEAHNRHNCPAHASLASSIAKHKSSDFKLRHYQNLPLTRCRCFPHGALDDPADVNIAVKDLPAFLKRACNSFLGRTETPPNQQEINPSAANAGRLPDVAGRLHVTEIISFFGDGGSSSTTIALLQGVGRVFNSSIGRR